MSREYSKNTVPTETVDLTLNHAAINATLGSNGSKLVRQTATLGSPLARELAQFGLAFAAAELEGANRAPATAPVDPNRQKLAKLQKLAMGRRM